MINMNYSNHQKKKQSSHFGLRGRRVVFIGRMSLKPFAMKNQAQREGLSVDRDVRLGVEILVTGKDYDQDELAKARAIGARIITEDQYWTYFTKSF